MTSQQEQTIRALENRGRILVTRLQYLGDVLLTLPMVDALRERFPNAEIDYLTRTDGADVLDGDPRFTNVWRVPQKSDSQLATLRLVRAMRKRRYALAIDLYGNPRSALLTRLSGARMRIGGSRRFRKRLYTHNVSVPKSVRAATAHHFYFLRGLGIEADSTLPTLAVSDESRARAQGTLREVGIGSEPVVGFHPGGKWEVKRWPVESFASLAMRLVSRGFSVIAMCGPGEEGYRDALHEQAGEGVYVLPIVPLRDLRAIVSELNALVVCDGGVMHLSVAVGTPTVGIFGSSEPDIWFPYESDGRFAPAYVPIECRPCHSHFCSHISCLNGLGVEAVESTLDGVLSSAKMARS